uniref:hypothetical protein n=1 Tax=Picosynechococcus sp. NKBG042902 TaxID=490193 RepID=UPI00403F3490
MGFRPLAGSWVGKLVFLPVGRQEESENVSVPLRGVGLESIISQNQASRAQKCAPVSVPLAGSWVGKEGAIGIGVYK